MRGAAKVPETITITRLTYSDRSALSGVRRLWRFTVEAEDGTLLDSSRAATRGLAWRMAKSSWRRAARRCRT